MKSRLDIHDLKLRSDVSTAMFVQRCISVESAREPDVVFMLADTVAAQDTRLVTS